MNRPTMVSLTNDDGDPYQAVSPSYAAEVVSRLDTESLADFLEKLAEEVDTNRPDLRRPNRILIALALNEAALFLRAELVKLTSEATPSSPTRP